LSEKTVPAATASSHNLVLYTVGPATSRALRAIRDTHLPHAQIYGEDAGNGEKLANMIVEHYNGIYDNTTEQKPALLFLVGEQRRDIIPKTLMSNSLPGHERIRVDELVVYETGEMASFEAEFRAAVAAGERYLASFGREEEVMWVVVFSPTGCDAMLRTLNVISPSDRTGGDGGQRRRRCLVVTIGPTTRDHLRQKYGFDPDVCAEKPSPEGIGNGIEVVMEKRRSVGTQL
jgi:uroporphyrinogen-III synthase